jgi:hypothetical protein
LRQPYIGEPKKSQIEKRTNSFKEDYPMPRIEEEHPVKSQKAKQKASKKQDPGATNSYAVDTAEDKRIAYEYRAIGVGRWRRKVSS